MLDFMMNFDFITPFRNLLISLTRKVRPFFTEWTGDWSPHQIDELLAMNGIQMLYWDTFNGELYFAVPSEQMDWAFQVLTAAGVPLLHERSIA